MKNRTILYGYKITNGKINIHAEESTVVKQIFDLYIKGKSLNFIADFLTGQKIPYYNDQTIWSKNKIARILENPRYAGADHYPAILSQTDYQAAVTKKTEMGGQRVEISPIIASIKSKTVCAQCGRNIWRKNKWRNHEKWFCPSGCKVEVYLDDKEIQSALHNVWKQIHLNPLLLKSNRSEEPYSPSMEVIRQSKEIERMKEQNGTTFGVLAKMILQCASHKYECCSEGYGEAFDELLIERCQRQPIDPDEQMSFIQKMVHKIAINPNGTLTVTLINGAEIASEKGWKTV